MPDIVLEASDGHRLAAHRVDPLETPRLGIVVVQEIFGVNAHIRAVVARFAAAGHVAIAPALFDRCERGIELGYDTDAFARGRALVGALEPATVLADIRAAMGALDGLPMAIVGYCYGGAVAWQAAHHLPDLRATVCYYGSRIATMQEFAPRVPTMMHVGRRDASFPLETVRAIAARYPDLQVHEYEAGHGFDCDHRTDFDSTASAHAMTRTLAFIDPA